MAIMALSGGEYIALDALEIVSIPILENVKDEYANGSDIEKEYRSGFGNMISEIYQNYRNILRSNPTAEVSTEFLWVTEAVQNHMQPDFTPLIGYQASALMDICSPGS